MSTIREYWLKPIKNKLTKLGDYEDMYKISKLPNDLLMKVLLFLPSKIVVSTSILSNRSEFLWM